VERPHGPRHEHTLRVRAHNIRTAASLLAWLRRRHTTLTGCRQGDIDQWLRTGPSASLARDFLTWAAFRGLAAQLPAAVLADLLGLHHNTAARWMHQAGGDWSRYAAELARHPHQP